MTNSYDCEYFSGDETRASWITCAAIKLSGEYCGYDEDKH